DGQFPFARLVESPAAVQVTNVTTSATVARTQARRDPLGQVIQHFVCPSHVSRSAQICFGCRRRRIEFCSLVGREFLNQRRQETVPPGNSELLEIMEFTRLAATLFRWVSCQLSSPFFGLPSAPALHWNWRTSPSATSSTS